MSDADRLFVEVLVRSIAEVFAKLDRDALWIWKHRGQKPSSRTSDHPK